MPNNSKIKQLFMADRITEREDYLVINNTYCRTLHVDMLPEQIQFGWFNRIAYMNGVTISVTLHPYRPEDAAKKVDSERIKLGAELIVTRKQGNTSRVDVLEVKENFYRHLLREINLHNTNIMSVSVVINVIAADIDSLNKKCAQIQDWMGATKLTPLYLRQLDGLRALLPGTKINTAHIDVTVSNAACVAPLINMNISHPQGVYFGENAYSSSPCFVDLFAGQPLLNGPHAFVTGMTRVGKSFTMKGLFARSLAIGRKIAVIDPEGEYKQLCMEFEQESEYVRLHPSMEVVFNPFDIEPEQDDAMGEFIDIAAKVDDIAFLISVMVTTQSGEKLTVEEMSSLSTHIKAEYEKREINASPDSIFYHEKKVTPEGIMVGQSKKEMPTFTSLTESFKDVNPRLYNILTQYCKGGPLGFFDGQTAMDLKSKNLVVFDLLALRNDHSKMFAMYVLLSWLWENYVKADRATQKHLGVDEAWLMMTHPYTAKFMSQIARRGAKYNTSLIAASQSFREFTTDEGIVFMNQCDSKFFLKMQTSDAEELGKIFNLSPELVAMISTFTPGQGILKLGHESGIVRFKGFSFEEHFLRSDPGAVQLR